MSKPTEELLQKFADQVRILGSIDFPYIARELGLNWFKDIRPQLKTNRKFLATMQEVLEELKYELYQGLLKAGRDGRKRNGCDPEITYVNAVIKHIDSGSLLGLVKSERDSETVGEDPEKEKEHLRRLGLLNEDKKSN